MTIISCFINCYPNKYLLGYSYIEQMKDILPYFVLSVFTFCFIKILDNIIVNNVLKLVLEIIMGGFVYLVISHMFRVKVYVELLGKFKFMRRGETSL